MLGRNVFRIFKLCWKMNMDYINEGYETKIPVNLQFGIRNSWVVEIRNVDRLIWFFINWDEMWNKVYTIGILTISILLKV